MDWSCFLFRYMKDLPGVTAVSKPLLLVDDTKCFNQAQYEKDLGIILSVELAWDHHYEYTKAYIIQNASVTTLKFSKSQGIPVKEQLYLSFIGKSIPITQLYSYLK